jgi:hypothetical protein
MQGATSPAVEWATVSWWLVYLGIAWAVLVIILAVVLFWPRRS